MRRNTPLVRRLVSSLLGSPATVRSAAAVVWRCPLRAARSFFVLFAGAVVATGCGGSSDPTAVETETVTITINDFVGSWSATSEVFTNNANSSETFNVIASGGEHRFTMLTGGRTRNWFELGDFSDEWDSLVTLNGAGDLLISTPAEASRGVTRLTFKLEGNTLTLTNAAATFDFTLSGAPDVSATMVAVFQKSG